MESLTFRSRLAQPTQQRVVSQSMNPCLFFQKGMCCFGDSCRFSHAELKKDAIPTEQPLSLRLDTRANTACQFYVRGCCQFGESCLFAHIGAVSAEKSGVESVPEEEEEDRPDSWVREIRGALVQFGDGVKVLKISFPSDFSAVHLTMLPPESSPSSVTKMLAEIGFTVSVGNVRVLPQGDTIHCCADIRVEDPSFAKRLCSILDSKKSTSGAISLIIATQINASTPQGSNSRRVDCKKVHCSWHRPIRTVWLNFGNQDIARKTNNNFSTGAYTVTSQHVKSSGPSSGIGYRSRGGGYRSPQVWTVMLTGVPATATQREIVQSLPPTIRPRHIELGQPSYKADLGTANAMIKSLFMQIGSLEWWQDATGSEGKRAKAKARFESEADARKAVTLLNGTALPFNKNGKITMQLVHSAKLKILDRIYQAVKARIDTEVQAWKSQHLTFIPYQPVRGYRTLKLEGEDNKAVAQAKNALEKILAGETVLNEEKTLWVPSFGANGDLYQKVRELEQNLGVVIIRNKRQSRLHLYGSPEKCKDARNLLIHLAKTDLSAQNIINLNQQQFVWACQGGFKSISTVLGEGAVAFDIISIPKKIIITGSEKDYKLAASMICEQKETALSSMVDIATDNDCAICWTEAENLVRTRCNHTYCGDCFESFCFSGATGNKELCIRCEGDSSRCMTILALDEIQEHLSSSTFEDLLEASFTSHIRRHPEEFHYCPTPDCDQVYRTSSIEAVLTCPNCLTPVCTTCHVSHSGMTCAEYKDHASGGYEALEKAKKQLGIKDCPKCKTAIEKTDGCDHVTCGGCKTHICWKCMETFKGSELCYGHMNKVHGSIGLDYI